MKFAVRGREVTAGEYVAAHHIDTFFCGVAVEEVEANGDRNLLDPIVALRTRRMVRKANKAKEGV